MSYAGLSKIQKALKAPKNQFNKFGKYNYRSCEDILEAVKPLLGNAVITMSDSIELIGDRYYVKATATYIEANMDKIECTAYAREAETKKGMDAAQITGSSSSYARKYALNGLLCIDDAKDDDARKPTDKLPGVDNSRPSPDFSTPPKGGITDKQIKKIQAMFREITQTAPISEDERKKLLRSYCSQMINKKIESSKELTKQDASTIIDSMKEPQMVVAHINAYVDGKN